MASRLYLLDDIPIEWSFVDQATLISQLEADPSIIEKTDEGTILHKAVTDGYARYANTIIDLYPSLVSLTNDDGDTPLHLATKIGDISILLKILESGQADCMKINKKGQTAFMVACVNHNVDAAITLVEGTNSKMMMEITAAFSRQQPAIIDCIIKNPLILRKIYKDKYKKTETILHKVMTEGYEEYAKEIINIFPSLVSFTNDDGNTPLHLAAQTGNVSILLKMLESGEADCMKINNQGQTAFILACLNNHIDAAIILVEKTSFMTTAELYAAILSRQPVTIDGIVEKFPNLVFEVDEEQATLLHKAVTDEYEECSTKIIDLFPLLVNFINDDGNTPLHLAAQTGNRSILLKMLESGEADCMKINNQGQTAFILACLNNHIDAARILVEGASSMTTAELYAVISSRKPVIIDRILDKFPNLVFAAAEEQSTLLHKVVTDGYAGHATKIIDLCPSLVSFTNDDGNTPLHLAAENGNESIVLKMLQSEYAPCMEMINKQGKTAFILACLNNHVDISRILVDAASSMTMVELDAAFSRQQPGIIDNILEKFPMLVLETDEEQSTLLHKACKSGNLEMAKTLLDVDQGIAEKVNKDGLTPLHYAAINGSVEILKEFLKKAPSSFNSTTQGTSETVFHLAARHQNTKLFIFMAQTANLCELLYNVDAEDNTVLHVAASVDSTFLVRYILKVTTIDVTVKNKNGFAAVDLLNKDGVDFPRLSQWFREDAEKIQRPSGYVRFQNQPEELIRNRNSVERKISTSREVEFSRDHPRNKKRDMHSESLQNARNTITIVAVLIASVAFTSGITPPGGVHQEGPFIGKATAGSTLAFKIFSVTNNIALFTSLSIVILLVSIISYTTKSLKKFVFIAHKMMWLAVASMATAYAAAAWITVPHQKGSKWLVYTTSAIASVALGTLFVYGSFMMVKHILKKGKLKSSLSHGKAASATLDLEAADDDGCYAY